MTTDFRALCVELTDCLEKADWPHRYKVVFQQWTDIARAALAEPEPSDEELLHVAARAIEPYESCGIAIGEYEPETECAVEVYGSELIAFARAVLARWGTPNSAEIRRSLGESVDGEVAELATAEIVRQLRTKAATEKSNRCHYSSKLLTRAADLLERLSPPQPVPVSERLPVPEECLDEGWAWFFNPRTGWRQATQPVHSTYTHWLPAHALPVPTND